jgi:hypothetical protein
LDAGAYFTTSPEESMEKAFWAQFQAPEHPPQLNNQMKQLVERFQTAQPVMEDICINLWPQEPLPTSLFGLVQRLRGASPRVDSWKWSAGLEGAERAYASKMVHYPKIKLLAITSGPPEGKNRTPKIFISEVREGAQVTEAQCSKSKLRF